MSTIFIYGLTLEDVVVYVGASVDPRRRLASKRRTTRLPLQVKILEEDPYDWGAAERHWIAKLEPILNKHPGGTGGCNWKPLIDDAFRARRSEKTSLSWQDPAKRAERLKTQNVSRWSDPEQKRRHIEKHTGAKRSAETRAKISAARHRYYERRRSSNFT